MPVKKLLYALKNNIFACIAAKVFIRFVTSFNANLVTLNPHATGNRTQVPGKGRI